MKEILKKSRIQYLINNRNGYLILASGAICLNVILSFIVYAMLDREKIVLVPPTIPQTIWISQNHVSSSYLSIMSLFLIELRFNLTPINAEMQRDIFLDYVDPAQQNRLKLELVEQENYLKKHRMIISFHATDFPLVNAEKLTVRIPGEIRYMIGDLPQPAQHVIYEISYRLHSGNLMIRSIDEVKAHA